MQHLPYWRLSAFYAAFFAILGGIVPYWTPYLKSLNFSASEIGVLMFASLHGTKVFSPLLWGHWADAQGKHLKWVRLGAVGSLLAFAAVYWIDPKIISMLLVMMAFSFFYNACLPQMESVTMSYLGEQAHRYSQIRVWGSLGFVVAVIAIGEGIELWGFDLLLAVLLALFALMVVASFSMAEPRIQTLDAHDHGRVMPILKQPQVLLLLVLCFALQASHGTYYTFYTTYMSEHGYSLRVIEWLWAWGVIAEVMIFMIVPQLIHRFGARNLLLATLALAALRWWLTAQFPTHQPLMWFSQALHAATFGVYHAVGVYFIHHIFVGRAKGRGQALYSSLTFGAGMAVGSLLSGFVVDHLGYQQAFLFSALLALVFFVLGLIWFKPGEDLTN